MSTTPLAPWDVIGMFRAASLMSKAWDSAGSGQWEEARSNIHKLGDVIGAQLPDRHYGLDLNILKLQIDYFTTSEPEAKMSGKICAEQAGSISISPANNHMKHYLWKMLRGCGARFPDSQDYFDALAAVIDVGPTDQSRVPKSLRYRMPLRA